MLHLTSAQYRGGHRVWLEFNDGAAGEVDLLDALEGPIFEPLRDATQFSQVKFDPEAHTIVRPNGADFAPEFLYHRVTSAANANPTVSPVA